MLLDQSVMEMNGSLPIPFTPGWSDGPGVGRGKDIRLESVFITSGVTTTRAMNSQRTISANTQRVMALTLEIIQGEASATLTDIPFAVTGDPALEVVFNSEHQNTPWSFLLKINCESGQMTLSFTLNYSGLSVDNALAGIRFYEALASGGEFRIRGSHSVTGGEVSLARGKLPAGTYKESDPRFLRLLEDLAYIQNKTGVSFRIPEHNIAYQDAQTIAATAKILKTGHAQYKAQPWVSVSKVEQAKIAVESFANEKPVAMALTFEGEVVIIFGTHVPLGPVTLFCNRSYITKYDLEELQKSIEAASPGSFLTIKFTPFEECPIEARYIKWLPKDEASAIEQLPMYQKTEPVDDWIVPQLNVDKAVALLKSWYDEDVDEQTKSWESLKTALDEDRLSDRKLFQ
jgi:hypothetical protein